MRVSSEEGRITVKGRDGKKKEINFDFEIFASVTESGGSLFCCDGK